MDFFLLAANLPSELSVLATTRFNCHQNVLISMFANKKL